MRLAPGLALLVACLWLPAAEGGTASYDIEQAVTLAGNQNPDIQIARKKVEAAKGGLMEARSGYLPSVVSTGLFREFQHQSESILRDEEYSASIRLVQSLYSGGAVPAQVAIGKLNLEKQELELQAVQDRVGMDVRVAFNELLLNQAKIHVREQSVGVLEEELKTQRDRFTAGTVGQLNVSRAEVALASEQPQLVDARTQANNSYLHLSELCVFDAKKRPLIVGQLQYRPRHPDLNECLARADSDRPEIRARHIDVAIEEFQEKLDLSETKPTLEAFSGYEVYNERDPTVGHEFNHGYVVGLNARWHIFDGFATRGRIIATRARRDAALQTLEAVRRSVASDVRSAFLDLQQADHVLESETKNVQTADESLEIAKSNANAGLATQLDVLQASTDVTRTRTTRLSAIYLHNVAVARLARACAVTPDGLDFSRKPTRAEAQAKEESTSRAASVARPPSKLSQR
jgi:outer membrane protein TolC